MKNSTKEKILIRCNTKTNPKINIRDIKKKNLHPILTDHALNLKAKSNLINNFLIINLKIKYWFIKKFTN